MVRRLENSPKLSPMLVRYKARSITLGVRGLRASLAKAQQPRSDRDPREPSAPLPYPCETKYTNNAYIGPSIL